MGRYSAETLYNLLPAVYRWRDQGEQAGALRALIAVLAGEAERLEEAIGQLYDNSFIETCEPWAAAYIGELLGVKPLYPVSGPTLDLRAQVANTIAYRRRKGTATMLEQLAHDTTGWSARAVEFFELLATTQHCDHPRPANLDTPDLRRGADLELLDSAFDRLPHTVDVRHIATSRGRHNLPNVGLFLWRLRSFHLARATAFAHGGGRFSFHPLGLDTLLFNLPQPETEITHLAEEFNVAAALRRRALAGELEALRQALADRWAGAGDGNPPARGPYFGPQPVFEIFAEDSEAVPPERILIADLSTWLVPAVERTYTVAGGAPVTLPIDVVVDPQLGRFVFTGAAPRLAEVSYAYGFSSPLGGGPYSRSLAADPAGAAPTMHIPAPGTATLAAAITAWQAAGRPPQVIQIDDNRTYDAALTVDIGTSQLLIRAAPGRRPTLRGDLTFHATSAAAAVMLDGLLLDGQIALRGTLGLLALRHTTLVPRPAVSPDDRAGPQAYASVVAEAPNETLAVSIEHSICGALCLPETLASLSISDSIIDPPHRAAQPVLLSGSLKNFPALTVEAGQLRLSLAGAGPFVVTLKAKPRDLPAAARLLEEAVRAAAADDAFRLARVAVVDNRLLLLPGVAGALSLAAVEGDPTARELRLLAPDALAASAFVGDRTAASLELRDGASIEIRQPRRPGVGVTLPSGPVALMRLGLWLDTQLEARFRQQNQLVWSLTRDDRLLLVWAGTASLFGLAGSRGDCFTLGQLALQCDWPAIAGDSTGAAAGPPARIERSTVLGPVHLRELTLAADSLLAGRLDVDRRQQGCVRFCYLAPGSSGPHPVNCCPDDAWPEFSSTVYPAPGYLQLAAGCSEAIQSGAGNGAEIGVFNELLQPQRKANLLASLGEYLRFGLEAGLIVVN